MSFIGAVEQGKTYAPGWFLAHEECERKTRQIPQEGSTTAANGGKYVKMGTIYPANDATAEGIVYEDVDVTTGDMPGSVVLKGVVYEDRLGKSCAAKQLEQHRDHHRQPEFCDQSAQSALHLPERTAAPVDD